MMRCQVHPGEVATVTKRTRDCVALSLNIRKCLLECAEIMMSVLG